jgi:hypothetical protein
MRVDTGSPLGWLPSFAAFFFAIGAVAAVAWGSGLSIDQIGLPLADREGTIWAPDERSAFGVNGTRLRWGEIEGKTFTLDIAATTNAVTSRWPAGLAFSAGRTATWSEGGGNSRYNSLGVTKGLRSATLEEFQTPDEGSGGYIAAPHALGPYIAYGWYETGSAVKGSCDNEGFACDYPVERGGLRLIEGLRRGRLVTSAPVAAFTLSNTGGVAYVRATSRWHNAWGPSVIEVITLWSPQVLQRIRVPGKVTNLAVSDRILAVKTFLGRSNRTAAVFYDLWTGKRLRSLRLEQDGFHALALKASTAVFAMGRNLVALEAYTGAKRTLRRSGNLGAFGLAFAGDNLVWYEQYRSDPKPRYRVMSMRVESTGA